MLQKLLLCPAPVIAEEGGGDECQLGADLTKQGPTSHYPIKLIMCPLVALFGA